MCIRPILPECFSLTRLDWSVAAVAVAAVEVAVAATAVVIIDGVFLYERPHHAEALPILAFLLALTIDLSMSASVKVLFTSTPGLHTVRAVFAQEDLILNVDALPRVESTPNDERFVRELVEGS